MNDQMVNYTDQVGPPKKGQSTPIRDNYVSENVQNIQQNHKLNHKCYGKLEGEIKKAEGQTQTEVNIQRGIFQVDSLEQLPFIIAMMTLNYELRKCSSL